MEQQYKTNAEILRGTGGRIFDLTCSRAVRCAPAFGAPRSMVRWCCSGCGRAGWASRESRALQGKCHCDPANREMDELIYERTAVEARVLPGLLASVRQNSGHSHPAAGRAHCRRALARAEGRERGVDYNKLYRGADRPLSFAAMGKMYQPAHACHRTPTPITASDFQDAGHHEPAAGWTGDCRPPKTSLPPLRRCDVPR